MTSSRRVTISVKALEALKAGVAERARFQDALEHIAQLGCIYSCDPAAYAIEVVDKLRERVEELEAEVKRLNDYVGDSVLPMEIDDGRRIIASAISGGADHIDGMPRQVRLVARDADGNETERQYLQTDERPRR